MSKTSKTSEKNYNEMYYDQFVGEMLSIEDEDRVAELVQSYLDYNPDLCVSKDEVIARIERLAKLQDRVLKSTSFYGNKVSEYGLQRGYVDYAALAKSFDAVLCNSIFEEQNYCEGIEVVNGSEYNEYGESKDVFQYYIISHEGMEILKFWTDELVWYYEPLDVYVWGITHYGTSWDYVLTDIPIDLSEEK